MRRITRKGIVAVKDNTGRTGLKSAASEFASAEGQTGVQYTAENLPELFQRKDVMAIVSVMENDQSAVKLVSAKLFDADKSTRATAAYALLNAARQVDISAAIEDIERVKKMDGEAALKSIIIPALMIHRAKTHKE